MDPTGSNEIQVETNVISVNIVELVKKNGFDNIRLGTCATKNEFICLIL